MHFMEAESMWQWINKDSPIYHPKMTTVPFNIIISTQYLGFLQNDPDTPILNMNTPQPTNTESEKRHDTRHKTWRYDSINIYELEPEREPFSIIFRIRHNEIDEFGTIKRREKRGKKKPIVNLRVPPEPRPLSEADLGGLSMSFIWILSSSKRFSILLMTYSVSKSSWLPTCLQKIKILVLRNG